MAKLTENEIIEMIDLSGEALNEIEKGAAVLNDLINEYCNNASKQDIFEQHAMIHNKLINGIPPREDQRQAYNWTFDYKIICIKLEIVFDYILSCRNILKECPGAKGEPGVNEVKTGAALGAA